MRPIQEITSVSQFAPQLRKPKKKYIVKPNIAVRRKTFALLEKMEVYCLQEYEARKLMSVSKRNRLCKLLTTTQEAFMYLKIMKKASNVRLTRFYHLLSRRQKEVLIRFNIKTLVDVSKITKQELAKLLRLGKGNPDPSFLIMLGLSGDKITKSN